MKLFTSKGFFTRNTLMVFPQKKAISFLRKCFFLFLSNFCFYNFSTAQTVSSGNPALFGIDGDLYSDTVMTGSFTVAGSHDWFFKTGGTGIGVFDTTGRAVAYNSISQGSNYAMFKKMQYPRYSIQGGVMLLDGTYYRDDVSAGSLLDRTTFAGGNKSTMDPSTWSTIPGGVGIQDKADIMDALVHMRRLTNSSNHLLAYVGASSLGTSGNRY
ncbi:MAG TPA: hypothetical protein VNS32_12630, partial [Flavisolibacter sp.]|nr:hypothetical protein [Flavisolibacter sp.]